MNTPMDRARLVTWIATGRAREAREGAGWTRVRVAETCGVTLRTVYRWENEARVPRGAAAGRYYALLDRWINGPEMLLTDEKGTER
ncbi:Homeodomain-like domain-containing protein [Streptomyces sp. 3213]|uniref:helix-turn-helix domain-containing protein n=1 Tax=Streptomyces sp. 3213.3 TaxID=1855348 RepID=UPI000898679F|nr:helix-turn-helix transcriptional regulator [Streptomyces sp. 3213.3]SEC89317.1 Homeodomain-like domain-containing protein [Streptomyces sp. 3213] [Streptomyces sp. 3213.3]